MMGFVSSREHIIPLSSKFEIAESCKHSAKQGPGKSSPSVLLVD
jgi:hypothetical protein